MKSKKIFKKEVNFFQIKYIILLIIIFLVFITYYYFFIKEINYFKFPISNKSLYIIPQDKGGKEIPNQNKKGLHLSYDYNDLIFENDDTLKFSIQLFTNENYNIVKQERDSLISKKNTIFLPEHLYIVSFKSNLGSEYMLLYKNFLSREKAYEHCNKFAYFLDKCLIVNVQNLH